MCVVLCDVDESLQLPIVCGIDLDFCLADFHFALLIAIPAICSNLWFCWIEHFKFKCPALTWIRIYTSFQWSNYWVKLNPISLSIIGCRCWLRLTDVINNQPANQYVHNYPSVIVIASRHNTNRSGIEGATNGANRGLSRLIHMLHAYFSTDKTTL